MHWGIHRGGGGSLLRACCSGFKPESFFPPISASYMGSYFSMVWLWIGVFVLRVLLPCKCWCWCRIGVSFCGRCCRGGEVLMLVLDRHFVLRALLLLVLVPDRRFVLRVLLPCWCWCWLWIAVPFCGCRCRAGAGAGSGSALRFADAGCLYSPVT